MRQKGFSLVEMMVALVLGMIVIASAIGLYGNTFGANSDQMKMSRLNNDLRTVMTQVTRDLRRAGYNNWGASLPAGGNFLSSPQAAPTVSTSAATIRYDLDASGGTAGSNEVFGFQWVDTDGDSHNDTIQTRIGSGSWSNLTDPSVIRISDFTITNNSPAAISPTGATATVTIPVYSIQIRGVVVAANCPAPNCMSGEACPAACISRSLDETVRLRNPILGTPPPPPPPSP